jgi:phage terminase large subunit GpA-like protein
MALNYLTSCPQCNTNFKIQLTDKEFQETIKNKYNTVCPHCNNNINAEVKCIGSPIHHKKRKEE